jgi:gas vesicle protein
MDSKKIARVLRALVSGDFDFEAPRRRTSSNVAIFLAGVGTGMVLGMLFAPVSGEQLRSEVSDRAREGFEKAKSTAQEFASWQKSSQGVTAASAEKSAS